MSEFDYTVRFPTGYGTGGMTIHGSAPDHETGLANARDAIASHFGEEAADKAAVEKVEHGDTYRITRQARGFEIEHSDGGVGIWTITDDGPFGSLTEAEDCLRSKLAGEVAA